MPFSEDVVAGALAGGVARVCVAPFDLIKIRWQIQEGRMLFSGSAMGQLQRPQYYSFTQTIREILRTEGVWAFWKGTLAAQLLTMLYGSVQFTAYRALNPLALDLIHKLSAVIPVSPNPSSTVPSSCCPSASTISSSTSSSESTTTQSSSVWSAATPEILSSLIAGSVGGCLATLVSYPFDLMRTRLAAQQEPKVYRAMSEGFRVIFRSSGLRGFYVGLWPTLVGITPYAALTFASYEYLKQICLTFGFTTAPTASVSPSTLNNSPPQLNSTALLFCGIGSGVFSKFVTFPFDVIKKRFQVAGFEFAREAKSSASPSSSSSSSSSPNYTRSVTSYLTHIIRNEGVLALYKGTLPSLLKAAPNSGITFLVFELCTSRLFPWARRSFQTDSK